MSIGPTLHVGAAGGAASGAAGAGAGAAGAVAGPGVGAGGVVVCAPATIAIAMAIPANVYSVRYESAFIVIGPLRGSRLGRRDLEFGM